MTTTVPLLCCARAGGHTYPETKQKRNTLNQSLHAMTSQSVGNAPRCKKADSRMNVQGGRRGKFFLLCRLRGRVAMSIFECHMPKALERRSPTLSLQSRPARPGLRAPPNAWREDPMGIVETFSYAPSDRSRELKGRGLPR
jgi:hypothetical protein